MIWPTIDIIIPVLDKSKDKYLPQCFASIAAHNYPQDKIRVIIKEGMPAEQAKGEALKEATGEYVCFLDSDNMLQANYLLTAVQALQENPHAFGVEARYGLTDNSLNVFLTHVLHIGDPVSELVSVPPKLITDTDWHYCFWKGAYPLGANGFVYRRKDLETVDAWFEFEDAQIPLRLMKAGFLYWIRPRWFGVNHYYVDTLGQFLRKRRRQAFHYMLRTENGQPNWTLVNPRMPKPAAILYCLTVLGPCLRALCNLRRSRLWAWYPVVCFTAALGTIWGYLTWLLGAEETDLQPVR